jgi:uncharacterized protein YbcI
MNEHPPGAEQVADEIAREIARVHEDSYGAAANDVEVLIKGNFVAVMMDVELTRGERTLVHAGSSDAVINSREAFQKAIAATFSAIIERATGRRVERFASRAVIDDGGAWAIEAFRLTPAVQG